MIIIIIKIILTTPTNIMIKKLSKNTEYFLKLLISAIMLVIIIVQLRMHLINLWHNQLVSCYE